MTSVLALFSVTMVLTYFTFLNILLLLFCPIKCNNTRFNFDFQQNDYILIFEHADLLRFNKDYLYYMKINTFKFNRTCTALNMTFKYKEAILPQVNLLVQTFKFASNEYRLFPLRFIVNACDGFTNNMAGFGKFKKCKNFSGCPSLKEKHYEICNFTPDSQKFPPFFPTGKYMTEIQGSYHSVEVWAFRFYSEVARPVT